MSERKCPVCNGDLQGAAWCSQCRTWRDAWRSLALFAIKIAGGETRSVLVAKGRELGLKF